MKRQIGTGFALAWIAALGVIIAAFIGLNTWMARPAAVVPTTPEIAPAAPVAETAPSVSAPPAPSAAPSPGMSAPNTVSNDPVTVLDLDHLGSAVHLREPAMGASKQVWAAELPIAQSLLQRPCDCDQRNWLKHYVKTAQDALLGSEDYVPSIQLLATLRRSNQDLTLSSQIQH